MTAATPEGRFHVARQLPGGRRVPCGSPYARLVRAKARAVREAALRHAGEQQLTWLKEDAVWILLAGQQPTGITVLDTEPHTSTQRHPGPNRWTRREDHIIDWVAIEIAAEGLRPVALTPTERRKAAWLMLSRGASHQLIARRLHISGKNAARMAADYYICGLALALPPIPRGETVADRPQAA
jgi:hypothetical protein